MTNLRRKRLAKLSFAEKTKILDKLRERSIAIANAGLRRKGAVRTGRDRPAGVD
jgi:hypothetical protein